MDTMKGFGVYEELIKWMLIQAGRCFGNRCVGASEKVGSNDDLHSCCCYIAYAAIVPTKNAASTLKRHKSLLFTRFTCNLAHTNVMEQQHIGAETLNCDRSHVID